MVWGGLPSDLLCKSHAIKVESQHASALAADQQQACVSNLQRPQHKQIAWPIAYGDGPANVNAVGHGPRDPG